MNDLDEVFDTYNRKTTEYNKEEWIEYKKQEKEDIYRLIDTTAEEIVSDNKKFKQYLDIQSKFDQYSVGNTLLITAQMPNATVLKDFEGWKNVGGYLNKHRTEVKILEPGDEYMREDGSVGTIYNVKKLYDISQVKTRQKMKTMRYEDKLLLKVLLNCSTADVQVVDQIGNTSRSAFYSDAEDKLYIARGAEAPKIFHEVTKELARSEIRDNSALGEFKSYCVSYMLCKKYNIDISNYNINVPFELRNMGARTIRDELEPMHDAIETINSRMTNYLDRISKENKQRANVR